MTTLLNFGSARTRLNALARAVAKADAVAGDFGHGLADRLKRAREEANERWAAAGYPEPADDPAYDPYEAGRRMRARLEAERRRRW